MWAYAIVSMGPIESLITLCYIRLAIYTFCHFYFDQGEGLAMRA